MTSPIPSTAATVGKVTIEFAGRRTSSTTLYLRLGD
jgi:hypothetical protein